MDSPGGYRPEYYILERSRRADGKTQLTRNPATYCFRDIRSQTGKSGIWEAKIVHTKPFLTPHLQTPKDIATKMGANMSGMQLYHRANFMPIRHTVTEIYVPGHRNKKKITAYLIYDKTHTSVAFAGKQQQQNDTNTQHSDNYKRPSWTRFIKRCKKTTPEENVLRKQDTTTLWNTVKNVGSKIRKRSALI